MSTRSDIPVAAGSAAVERDEPSPGIVRLRLNRPAQRNVMDAQLRDALDTQLAKTLADTSVRAIILAGSPKVFSGGGDIRTMEGIGAAAARARLNAGHQLVRRLATAEKPIVAAPNGWAIGAAVGLLLLCDCVVAGRSSLFGFPFFRLALVPDWGITKTLPQRVGLPHARRLLLQGATVEADEALAIGLVDLVVDDKDIDDLALQRAQELGRLPRQAFALTKQLLASSRGLHETLELEAAAQALCLVSEDAVEGRTAFFEKREPNF